MTWTFDPSSSMDFSNPNFKFDGSVSTAAPLGAFQSAAPQDLSFAREIAGYAVVFAAAFTPPAPSGAVAPTSYTFGSHAVAIYNAEAAKSQIQRSVATPPVLVSGILGKYQGTAEQTQDRPTVAIRQPAVAGSAPSGVLARYAVVPEQFQDRPTITAFPAAAPPGTTQGILATLYTFGTHAVALYNAEAQKTQTWKSAAQAVALQSGILGAYTVASPQRFDSTLQPVLDAPTFSPQGALVSYHAPDVFDPTQAQPQRFAMATGPVAPSTMLGRFTWSAPQAVDFTTQSVFVDPLIGTPPKGILGAYTVTAPQLDFTLKAVYSAPIVGALATTGRLGSYTVTGPQTDLVAQPVFDAPPLHAPLSVLGTYANAAPQAFDFTLQPVIDAPTFAPQGAIVMYHEAAGQNQAQPSAQKFGISTLSALTTGILGSYSVTAEQRQDRPTVVAWRSASPVAMLGRYTVALEQIQDRPSTIIWPSVVQPPRGILGSYSVTAEQFQDRPTRVSWPSAIVQPPQGILGRYFVTTEQFQERPTITLMPIAAPRIPVIPETWPTRMILTNSQNQWSVGGPLPYAEFFVRVGDVWTYGIDWNGWLANRWRRGSLIPAGIAVQPNSPNGYEYFTPAGGQSASSEPIWPKVIGSSVLDGSVDWVCQAVDTASLSTTVASAAWIVPTGIVVAGVAINGQITSAVLDAAGAVVGANYPVNCVVTMTDREQKVGQILLKARA